MPEITNLNKFRKAKAKAEKEVRAQNNRVTFGTPKHLKTKAKGDNLLTKKRLEGKEIL
jgi:hypothetical protein